MSEQDISQPAPPAPAPDETSEATESAGSAAPTSPPAPAPSADENAVALAKPHDQDSLVGNVMLGLKVVGGELKWLVQRGVRSFELKQLRKRLLDEYTFLGQLTAHRLNQAEPLDPEAITDEALARDENVQLAIKQIDFLREEIALLQGEQQTKREAMLASRRKQLKLDQS
ncbi:MAG: hypothetical protein D6E12_11175 [Desulfovibrio sp.]|nr:MAG: hypothetical protein D6E12_11175 [Desulfovibrio sp.]